MALGRIGSEWHEAACVQLNPTTSYYHLICSALSDSRVLIGQISSTYLELFCVESGPRITPVHRLQVPEQYRYFSAKCDRDTFVAMSSENDAWVSVHRLCGDRLEELVRTHVNRPGYVLWVADRLLAEEGNESTVIELEVYDASIERRRQLIATHEKIYVLSWCAVDDGFAIYNMNSNELRRYTLL